MSTSAASHRNKSLGTERLHVCASLSLSVCSSTVNAVGGLYKITYHSMSTYYSQHHNISAANSTQKNAQMGVCERTAGGP